MTIVSMLGFDDHVVFAGLQTSNTLFKSPIDNSTISLMQYVGNSNSTLAVIARNTGAAYACV